MPKAWAHQLWAEHLWRRQGMGLGPPGMGACVASHVPSGRLRPARADAPGQRPPAPEKPSLDTGVTK